MAGQFDLQQNFPIASVADLIAQRPQKEAQMRLAQQQQLVQGLQGFGQGVQSLVDRRDKMAQALALSQLYAKSPQGQQVMGTNQVATGPLGSPVTMNQTAAYNPSTGTVTPNQSVMSPEASQMALFGAKPEDVLNNLTAQQRVGTEQGQLALNQKIEPQKLAIEARKAAAEEENAKMMRLIQGLVASSNMKNQAQERTQAAENAAFEANKETAKHFILHPINAYKASKAIVNEGNPSASTLPKVGETIVHPSGVKITRKK